LRTDKTKNLIVKKKVISTLYTKNDEYLFNIFLMFTNVSISVAEEEKNFHSEFSFVNERPKSRKKKVEKRKNKKMKIK
jgi:hypothetical protein